MPDQSEASPVTHGFDAPVLVTLDEGGASVRLVEERVYTARQGDSWRIPAGFETDFATIPAVVAWAVPKLGIWTTAAIVHDLLCEGLNEWERAVSEFSPRARRIVRRWPAVFANGRIRRAPVASAIDADRIFRRIARDHGADPVTAEILYVGVRWGALANPARREGWLRTAPRVLGSSLLLLPVLLPATVLAVVGRAVLHVARWLAR